MVDMITLVAQQDLESVRLSLSPESQKVEKVPGLVAGVPSVELVLFGAPSVMKDTVRLAAAASILTGLRHFPLRESIQVVDKSSGARLAYLEKL